MSKIDCPEMYEFIRGEVSATKLISVLRGIQKKYGTDCKLTLYSGPYNVSFSVNPSKKVTK